MILHLSPPTGILMKSAEGKHKEEEGKTEKSPSLIRRLSVTNKEKSQFCWTVYQHAAYSNQIGGQQVCKVVNK